MELPELYTVKDTAATLGLRRTGLQKYYDRLHILRLPKNHRRFSVAYLSSLIDYLQLPNDSDEPSALQFARTPQARTVVEGTESQLSAAIAERLEPIRPRGSAETVAAIGLASLATVLNVGYTTLTGLETSGALPAVVQGRTRFVTEAAIWSVIGWERPKGMEQPAQEL